MQYGGAVPADWSAEQTADDGVGIGPRHPEIGIRPRLRTGPQRIEDGAGDGGALDNGGDPRRFELWFAGDTAYAILRDRGPQQPQAARARRPFE